MPSASSRGAGQATEIPLAEVPETRFAEPAGSERGILREIYFEYDRSLIRPEHGAVLREIATWLRLNPERQLLIEGHCDERGTEEYNLSLGERRALAVRFYLAGLGVPPWRVHTVSFGEERPVVVGHGEDAWSRNRRAAFQVSAPRRDPLRVSALDPLDPQSTQD